MAAVFLGQTAQLAVEGDGEAPARLAVKERALRQSLLLGLRARKE